MLSVYIHTYMCVPRREREREREERERERERRERERFLPQNCKEQNIAFRIRGRF